MSNERARPAAGAVGAVGAALAFLAGAIWVLTDFRTEFGFFATPKPLSPGELLLTYAGAPVLLGAAGVPPARALGAGWPLSLLAPAGASLTASLLVINGGFEPWAVSCGLVVVVGSVALAASVGTGGGPAAILALVVVTGALILIVVAMLSAESFLVAALVSVASWVVLPAVAGLFQHPRDREEGSS